MKKNLLQYWPLYASILILTLLSGLLLATSFYQNQGHLVYALDDAYIHMSMARNFSHYGVWGVTRYGFTSSSSSILWTLLLSLTYYLFGVRQIAPLVWNLLFALLVLWIAFAILTWYKLRPAMKFAALLVIIYCVPLPTLILSGLEQNLQTVVALLAAFFAAQTLSHEAPSSTTRDAASLLMLAPLVTAVRFEGMFLIFAIGVLILFRKRWTYALAFAVCGFLPVVIYGIISVRHGWFWLPSSVLLKGVMPDLSSLSGLFFSLAIHSFRNLYEGLHVFVLLIVVLLFYILACGKGCGPFDSRQLMGAILLLTAVPHVEFVQVGPLFRYDAYLFPLGVVFVACTLPVLTASLPTRSSFNSGLIPQYFATGALALLLFFPLTVKGSRLLWLLPRCTTNIFEQQYQMGVFINQYYQGSTVALNDVGAANFLADFHCLDLWGLANREVTSAKRNNSYCTRDIAELSRQSDARIALLYDQWFTGAVGGLPSDWAQVGQWTVPNNVILGGDTVSIYAVDPSEVPHLIQCLRGFSRSMPRDVIQRGIYLEPQP